MIESERRAEERQRWHEDLRPEPPSEIIAESRKGAPTDSLFGSITVPRGYRVKVDAHFHTGDWTNLGLSSMLHGNQRYDFQILGFPKALRERWPDDRLYIVLDNFSPHKHHQVRAWAADNDVDLVFTPTYTSWLNWIESDFAALRYFALGGTDHRSPSEQNTAIAGYIRWRNHRCGPKTGFAINSAIRTWTSYPATADLCPVGTSRRIEQLRRFPCGRILAFT